MEWTSLTHLLNAEIQGCILITCRPQINIIRTGKIAGMVLAL
jgi:hypothetical protein